MGRQFRLWPGHFLTEISHAAVSRAILKSACVAGEVSCGPLPICSALEDTKLVESRTSPEGIAMSVQITLTDAQRQAIIELGARGAGGHFDPAVMSQLFTLGIVDIRSDDRRLVLTEIGKSIFTQLTPGDCQA